VISDWWIGNNLEGSGHGLNLRYNPGIRLEELRKTTSLSQDNLSPGPRFEPGTYGIWNRSVNHSTKFGMLLFFMSKGKTISELPPPTAYCLSSRWYKHEEPRWNVTDRVKLKELGEKPVPVPLCSTHISHGLTRAWTKASAVRGWGLTAWTTVELYSCNV
jgi:hypothetical protein